MYVSIQDDILNLHAQGLLAPLLADKTTGRRIMWASDAYAARGSAYGRNAHITPSLITGENSGVIKTRARKALEQQAERTKKRAEVFTPVRVCRRMIDDVDEAWLGRPPATPPEKMPFDPAAKRRSTKARSWWNYVDSRRLEPACGEAPYLTTRYDPETGEYIPPEGRTGILDRKLRAVNENATDTKEWQQWTERAFQSTYGYEFSGDNVLIARVNLLMTFAEHFERRMGRKPSAKEYRKIITILVWNVWQMDGLNGRVPYKKRDEGTQMSLLDLLGEAPREQGESEQPLCRAKNWRSKKTCTLWEQRGKEKRTLKFDTIIGNPPYQEEASDTVTTVNGQKPRTNIFQYFQEQANSLAQESTVLIYPGGRWIHQSGKGLKTFGYEQINDNRLALVEFYPKSKDIFSTTDIPDGITIVVKKQKKTGGGLHL